ncbi:MAG: hypothetical protein NVS3B26_11600 [Mycobacteriales bacterium]
MSLFLIDVTQFSRQPARSGVQRALLELARAWPTGRETAFVARAAGGALALDPAGFAKLVAAFFQNPAHGPDEVQRGFAGGRPVSERDLSGGVLLLPEPTFDPEVLTALEQRIRSRLPTACLAYDAFPQTDPWAFPGNGQAATSPYFRLVAEFPVAVATSDVVHEVLVHRLRRVSSATPIHWLGADHVVGQRSGAVRAQAEVLMVGTVEPRKRVSLALAAVDMLRVSRPDARLHVVGRPGCEEPDVLARLAARSRRGDGVRWEEDASDNAVQDALASATVLLCLGDEGYGLPAIEAAVAGCPVAFAGQQPAAALLEGRGAWPVDRSSAEALAASLQPWMEPAVARERQSQVDTTGLPTWEGFSRSVSGLLGEL